MQNCHMQNDIPHAPHIKKKKTIVQTFASSLVYLFIGMINVKPTVAVSNQKHSPLQRVPGAVNYLFISILTAKGTRCSELSIYIYTHHLLYVKLKGTPVQ